MAGLRFERRDVKIVKPMSARILCLFLIFLLGGWPHTFARPGVGSSSKGSLSALGMVRWRMSLHGAAESGNLALLELKLKELQAVNADSIHARDPSGNTPLHWAARGGQLEAVRFLLDRGADTDLKNQQGERPVDLVPREKQDVLTLIVNYKRDKSPPKAPL